MFVHFAHGRLGEGAGVSGGANQDVGFDVGNDGGEVCGVFLRVLWPGGGGSGKILLCEVETGRRGRDQDTLLVDAPMRCN